MQKDFDLLHCEICKNHMIQTYLTEIRVFQHDYLICTQCKAHIKMIRDTCSAHYRKEITTKDATEALEPIMNRRIFQIELNHPTYLQVELATGKKGYSIEQLADKINEKHTSLIKLKVKKLMNTGF